MELEISESAHRLYRESIVWDMVWPWEPQMCDNDFDKLERFHRAGFTLLSATVAGDNQNISEAIQKVARARRALEDLDRVILCETVADVTRAKAEGKLAVMLHFEGTRNLERNLDMVAAYYKLGVRYMILAFNNANSVGGGLMDPADAGLTAFGRQLVRELERVGMLMDLSHTGHRTAMEAMEMATSPCVFTHSNVAAIFPHPRNLADEEIRACAATGGLVGIPSSSMYHGDLACKPQTLFEHLDYIVQLVGSEHAGLGLDYIFDPLPMVEWMKSRPDEWPDAKDPDWPGVATAMPEDVLALTELMVGAGYGDRDVRNVLGENYMRICGTVWK